MKIHTLRTERNMSQAQLAVMAGVTQGYISHLEVGVKKNPSIKVLMRIAQALEVAVDELLEDEAIEPARPPISVA